MRLWTCSHREFQRRPGRALLTLLGVALGLAVIVATRLTINTVRQAYRDLFAPGGGASLEVTADDLGGFDPDVVAPLASVPGVRAVIRQVQGVAAVLGDAGNVPVPILGVEPCNLPPVTGAAGVDDDAALLEPALADSLRLTPGQPVEAWGPGGRVTFRRMQTLGSRQDTASGRLIVPLLRAQQLFALPGHVNGIRLVLAEGADASRVREVAARLLPDGFSVQPPGARAALGAETLSAAEGALRALGWVALATAAIVVLNTFLLGAGERRRQLAVLRTLGATRAPDRLAAAARNGAARRGRIRGRLRPRRGTGAASARGGTALPRHRSTGPAILHRAVWPGRPPWAGDAPDCDGPARLVGRESSTPRRTAPRHLRCSEPPGRVPSLRSPRRPRCGRVAPPPHPIDSGGKSAFRGAGRRRLLQSDSRWAPRRPESLVPANGCCRLPGLRQRAGHRIPPHHRSAGAGRRRPRRRRGRRIRGTHRLPTGPWRGALGPGTSRAPSRRRGQYRWTCGKETRRPCVVAWGGAEWCSEPDSPPG